jgi:hypothetical protein
MVHAECQWALSGGENKTSNFKLTHTGYGVPPAGLYKLKLNGLGDNCSVLSECSRLPSIHVMDCRPAGQELSLSCRND